MTCECQLIQCKADPNTVNEHGNTPLHYACFWGQDEVAEVQYNTPTDTPLPLAKFVWLKCPLLGRNGPYSAYKAVPSLPLSLLLITKSLLEV